MGFDTIIAGIYFVAVLIVSGYVITDTVNRMSDMSYESVLTAATMQLNKIGSSATITKIDARVGDEGGVVYVNLLNTGQVKISSADFPKMDILLTYTDSDTGIAQTHWCYYSSDGPLQNPSCDWAKNSTISPNPSPSLVDPLNWDPSTTLSITIQLAQSQYVMPGSAGYLKVVLPGGSSTAGNFTFTG